MKIVIAAICLLIAIILVATVVPWWITATFGTVFLIVVATKLLASDRLDAPPFP